MKISRSSPTPSLSQPPARYWLAAWRRSPRFLLWSGASPAAAYQQAIENASIVLADFKETSTTLRSEIVGVSGELNESLDAVQMAVDEVREGVADVRHTLSADSTVARNLSIALDEIAAASQAIAELAEFLRLHPNALISGRQPTTE